MSNYTILIIDYEPRSLELTVQPLQKAGYYVQVAHDGVAGLKAFHELQPDLVIIEAMIPKKHGFEVCQEIKKTPAGCQVPVIITTAVYRGRKYQSQAHHIYQCDEYLEKPIPADKLLEVCKRLLAAAHVPGGEAGEPVEPPPPPKASPKRQFAPPKKPSLAPIVEDLTEQEIIERLDAILPGDPGGPGTRAAARAAQEKGKEEEKEAETESSGPHEDRPGSVVAGNVGEIPPDPSPVPSAAPPEPSAESHREVAGPEGGSRVVPFEASRKKRAKNKKKHTPGLRDAGAVAGARGGGGAEALPEQAPGEEPLPNRPDPPRIPVRKPSRKEPPSDPPLTPAARSSRRKPAPPPAAVPVPGPVPFAGPRRRVWWMEKPWKLIAVVVFGLAVGLVLMLVFGGSEEASPFENVAATTPSPEPPEAATPQVQPKKGPRENEPVEIASVSGAVEAPREQEPAIPAPTPPSVSDPDPPASRKPSPKQPAVERSSEPVARNSRPRSTPPPRKKVQPEPTPPPRRQPETSPITPPPTTQSFTAPVEKKPARTSPPVEQPRELPSRSLESIERTARRSTPSPPVVPVRKIEAGDLVDLRDVDSMPVVKTREFPTYGASARRREDEGTVVLDLLINEKGKVEEVRLVSGIPGSDLNKSSVKAARRWTYRPAMKDGVPVKVWKKEKIVFKL